MRIGVPFIAPRDLGAVGAPFGRLWLPSVHGCTGLAGTPDGLAHRANGPVNYSWQRLIFLESWLFGGPCTRPPVLHRPVCFLLFQF
jgi:hypothetical protein